MLVPAISPLLANLPGIRHAFFTRHGGVSTGLYDSLNVGRGSDDDPAAVEENRRRCATHFGQDEAALLTGHQIHSNIALTATSSFGAERPQGDAVVTATPGLVCGALSADCAPILIADPQARIVAAAHAGWKGALGGIAESAIQAMVTLGAARERLVAAVGPCIGPQSYEVGQEFEARFVAADAAYRRFFSAGATADKRMFDLPAFVLARLAAAGVRQAAWTGHDTCADSAFFSNRRAFKAGERDYGRLLSAIVLEA